MTKPPSCYAEWLDCFERLRTKSVDSGYIRLLQQGSCRDADAAIAYLEQQLVLTENVMLKRFVREFRRALEMHIAYGEYDGLYRIFERTAKKLEMCLFFVELDFMSVRFREELRESVQESALQFWNSAVEALYRDCIENHQVQLEDQLWMIRRIKLFRERKMTVI